MKKTCVLLAFVWLLGLVGCGDGNQAAAEKTAQTMRQSFDSAPEELKAKYQAVTAALESNDFAKAKTGLDELQRMQLSPEQQGAVLEQKQTLMLKAGTAAQNGDQVAAKVIQDLRSQSRSR